MNYDYTTVPNQRTIVVNKELCNKDNIYATINIKALAKACSRLRTNAFKMWIYFAKNQDKYTFALSKRDTCEWCGFSDKTYQNAFNELADKGYLICKNDGSNKYNFYEVPKEK